MGFLDGNNFLGNWFYKNLTNKMASDPVLTRDVYQGNTSGKIAGIGAGFNLQDLGASEVFASEPNYDYSGAQSRIDPYAGSQSTGNGGVLGDSTVYTAGTSGTTTGTTGTTSGGTSGPSYQDQMKSQIEGGYNNYFGELDNMLNGLGNQKTAQESIANTSYNTNLNDLGLQKQSNLGELQTQERKTGENQVKTLKDISNNIRNLMNAGNTYLGSMGAGDSSAVNQYAYGLTKLGSQQRGDVQSQTASILSDIGDRKAKLDNIFMQEKNRLAGERDSRIAEIADWFSNAQMQLQQAKANGQLAKSTDLQNLTTTLYNQAVNALTALQNQTMQKQSMLEQWAMNNSQNLAGLKQNMAAIGAYQAPKQQAGSIQGRPQFAPQGTQMMYGGGMPGLTEDQKRLLGLV